MANAAITTPNLLTDPGFLYWAPLGTTEPTGTVVGSVFTDTWPVSWVPLGMTDAGSDFDPTLTTAPIVSAESIDPIAYRTTDRATTVTFMLMSFTATNLQRALNGAATTVTGSTTTTLTKLEPPTPGTETRCMLGWESLDSTVRWIARQVINSGSLKMTNAKSPAHAAVPWTGQLEKPAGTVQPFGWQFAGTNRA
jgi:hypothetical protein